jgi:hypothetical protein
MYIKLNFTNTVSWATIFNMVRTILAYNINSVNDLVGNVVTTTNPSGGNGIYSLTASGTSGTNALTLSATSTAVAVGQLVTGTNIPAGTYVTAFTSGTTGVTISKNITGNISSGTVVFSYDTTSILGSSGTGTIYNTTEKGYLDTTGTNSEIYRTTSAYGNAGVLPGVGAGFDSVPWCYYSPNNSFQDLVFRRTIKDSSPAAYYYVRLRFDGLNLNLTPFKTANTNDTWITSPNATGVYFNTSPSLTNGPATGENCIGYNMTAAYTGSSLPIGSGVVGGATSFFMHITPNSILIGGKGPTGSAGYSSTGWMTTPANRTIGVTLQNGSTLISYAPSSTVIPSYLTPANTTTTTPSSTGYTGTVAASGVNNWSPLGWNGATGSSIALTGINTQASPTTLVGWQVTSNNSVPLNNFATIFKVDNVSGSAGAYSATIYLIGGTGVFNTSSQITSFAATTAAGAPVNVSSLKVDGNAALVAGNQLTFSHPPNRDVSTVLTDGSRCFFTSANITGTTGFNPTIGTNNFCYARTATTLNSLQLAVITTANSTNLIGYALNSTILTGELGLSALRTGKLIYGATSTVTGTPTMQVDGYYPHNPYNDAVSLYQGAAHFGPAFVSEYTPYDATSTVANNNYNVIFNGGYQFHQPSVGNPKAWYGMASQDFLWGDAYFISQSYKILNIRKPTPNVQQSYSTDTPYAPVYIGTDARTIERAPLGDWNVGTNTGAVGAAPYPVYNTQAGTDRTLAPALVDLPNYKFPDASKNPSYGLFPIVWSNSSYNMAGGKITTDRAGFMLFNGDYTGPDDYFNYTPPNGTPTTYAIWPMADGYSRRLGIAVPKA